MLHPHTHHKQGVSTRAESNQTKYLLLLAQLCLQNNGRPAAAALVELVRAACEAYAAGISLERLVLELEHGGHIDHQVQSPGYWLTAADRSYRNQWLKTVRAVCK